MRHEILQHFGTCDASAALALDSHHFIVASDEDNLLRLYRAHESGKPVQVFDLKLLLPSKWRDDELDIEGACFAGGPNRHLSYWITSHGRNRGGKRRRARHQLFALRLQFAGGELQCELAGQPYSELFQDIRRDRRLQPFGLEEAEKRPPKAPGGLNIEGLASTPDGRLLIGFRNPIPQGRAMVLPMLNPIEVIDGESARFGDPVLLELGGLGVRSIDYWPAQERFLIIAGAFDSEKLFQLYSWSGKTTDQPVRETEFDFGELNPEALVFYPGEDQAFLVLSDDGGLLLGEQRCKELPGDSPNKFFRSTWCRLAASN